jgi:hypothetical protein
MGAFAWISVLAMDNQVRETVGVFFLMSLASLMAPMLAWPLAPAG